MFKMLKNLLTGASSPQPTRPVPVYPTTRVDPAEAVYAKRREATALQRAGDTDGAVRAVEEGEAMAASIGMDTSGEDLRRAKYLQKAGRADEGWAIYASKMEGDPEGWGASPLYDAMRLHLQRDGQAERAIWYGIACHLAKVALYRDMRADADKQKLNPLGRHAHLFEDDDGEGWDEFMRKSLEESSRKMHEQTIEIADRWLSMLLPREAITEFVTKLAKKAKAAHQIPELVAEVEGAIADKESPKAFIERHDR